MYGWMTTAKCIKDSKKATKFFNKLCKYTPREIAINIVAHKYPKYSDSIVYEVTKEHNGNTQS